MLSAYVLIESELGKVAQAIRDLDGVRLAEDLAGPYDVIANVQASGLDELGRLIVFRIQALDGVTRTPRLYGAAPVAAPTPHGSPLALESQGTSRSCADTRTLNSLRLLCAVKPPGGFRRRVGRSAPAAGTAGGR
jgi:hypothetical protein